jgi:hypothetical protein
MFHNWGLVLEFLVSARDSDRHVFDSFHPSVRSLGVDPNHHPTF